ncbi:hypothetical protein BDU57DRAFT_529529 [Ampelomyces quisqualis]|uniref:Uncharacterized protein n=1 Tax=Ampelomyces quisqualis TaxID=50730 RepID=A0A6A5QPL7_AMPQU|nr:hypothetical protein BDU57DRAFT_529529 [Ampelomyces quisqualis]
MSRAGSENANMDEELALSVLLCINSIQSDLLATFDSNPSTIVKFSKATSTVPAPASKRPTQDLINFDEPKLETTAPDNSFAGGNLGELDFMQMQALRRSALKFFDKWRASVMLRVCEVLSVRSETVRQANAKRKQMSEAAEKQSQDISSLIDFEEDPFASNTSQDR